MCVTEQKEQKDTDGQAMEVERRRARVERQSAFSSRHAPHHQASHPEGQGARRLAFCRLSLTPPQWSLYWKTSMATKTEILDPLELEVESTITASALKALVAKQLQWEPVEELLRLEGFGARAEAGAAARSPCLTPRNRRRGAVGAVRHERCGPRARRRALPGERS